MFWLRGRRGIGIALLHTTLLCVCVITVLLCNPRGRSVIPVTLTVTPLPVGCVPTAATGVEGYFGKPRARRYRWCDTSAPGLRATLSLGLGDPDPSARRRSASARDPSGHAVGAATASRGERVSERMRRDGWDFAFFGFWVAGGREGRTGLGGLGVVAGWGEG